MLRLHGWVIPEVDVLHVVMEKADRSLLSALQEGLPLYRRMRIALDVAEGLKAIHDVDYVYEDLKPGNILVGLVRNYFYNLKSVLAFEFCLFYPPAAFGFGIILPGVLKLEMSVRLA